MGVTALFGLLLMSLHILLALHTRSIATAAAWDAGRAVALDGGVDQAEAEARVDQLLGKLHPGVSWAGTDADTVVVTVSVSSPGLLPGVTSLDRLRRVSRTVRVRREALR